MKVTLGKSLKVEKVVAEDDTWSVDGSPADKEESGSCLENTEDDLVLSWMFMDASSVELNQTEKTETEVLALFEAGKTGTGLWAAEIELQVVTFGGLDAVDNGEQVTVTWIVSTFEIELNVN